MVTFRPHISKGGLNTNDKSKEILQHIMEPEGGKQNKNCSLANNTQLYSYSKQSPIYKAASGGHLPILQI